MSALRSFKVLGVGLAAALAAAACGGSTENNSGSTAAKADVKVGLIYSKTGALAAYGQEYEDGFKIGLDYVTKGTGKVNGHKIVVSYNDDAGDPAKAVSTAKDLIGQGYNIIGGSTASGVAVQVAPIAAQNKVLFVSGPAATDAVTAINRYTFRSGRQSQQDVLTAKAMLGDVAGKKVLVFAQDSAFGQSNVAAVKSVFTGATVTSLLVPPSANDFTTYAKQAKDAKVDMVFVAWAGSTATAMWTALDQQGVTTSTTVVTGLAERSTYPTFGAAGSHLSLLSLYFYQAPKNPVNDYLVSAEKKNGTVPDLFTPDGFVTAELVAHAVDKADGDNVDKMISALEGYTFNAPKGQESVRAADHAMLQPMFVAKLDQQGSSYEPTLLKTLSADQTAPPQKPMAS
ncbi:MAG TPA: substrate-binding domain-containing protein [Candidatus Dormibacteraeota bacterium]